MMNCFNRKCIFFDQDIEGKCSESRISSCGKVIEKDSAPDIEVVDLESLLCYIREYEDGIFVRDGIKTMALKDLPNNVWANKVARFIEDGILPVRVRREIEINNGK